MFLGSHNSWSYAPLRHWWQKPLAFTARCQSVDIRTQYLEYGVRCFDLRVKFDSHGNVIVVHNFIEYDISYMNLMDDLWFLNSKKGCFVRVLLDIRKASQLTEFQKERFRAFCSLCDECYPNIVFWNGCNLCDGSKVYQFKNPAPSCRELYASVVAPRLIDDWWPWLYARFHNRKNIRQDTDCQFLLIDFVNIQ